MDDQNNNTGSGAQSPAPVAGEEDARPASEQPVEAIGAGREDWMGGEVEALREALIQADLKIRSLPGTDQSDVEFIRQALAASSPSPAQGRIAAPPSVQPVEVK